VHATEAVVEITDVVAAAVTLARSGDPRTHRQEIGRL
jgi:hypothetical protein